MKNKLVLWGSNAQDERLLIALELRPDDNMVNVYTFPEGSATEAFSQLMLNDWRDDKPVEFPENHTRTERTLSITESMLPEGLKVERDDILQRAQTEWHFIVLSSKLNETYHAELEELRERVDKLKRFEEGLWEELKAFWDKVQAQVRDRNLFRDHANELRDRTNELFTRMKSLRSKLDEEFEIKSQEHHDRFMAALEEVEERLKKGLRLQPLFEELKTMQREFRDIKFTREHRGQVWKRLDSTFKRVKEKRFGSAAADDRSPLERLKRRYDGLMSAIDKMERSIKRDNNDLQFENRKIERSDGQLEAQLRKAKIKMIEERIRSKEEKLAEMLHTKSDLDRRLKVLQEKEAQRAEQERLEDARRKAQEKIAEEIKHAAEAREEQSETLEKAAEEIKHAGEAAGKPANIPKEEAVAEPSAETPAAPAEAAQEATVETEPATTAEEPAAVAPPPAVKAAEKSPASTTSAGSGLQHMLDEVVSNAQAIAQAVSEGVESALNDLP